MTIQKQFELPWQVDNNVVVLSTICWQHYISAKLTDRGYDENIDCMFWIKRMQIVFTYLFALPGEKYYVYKIDELLL